MLPRLRYGGDESGSASIETAAALGFVLLLAFWLMEMCMFGYTLSVLEDAAHEGVRYAISHGAESSNCSGPTTGCTDTTGANVKAVVKNIAAASLHQINAMTVTVSYPDTTGSKAGSLVKVSISYQYVPYVNSLGFQPTASISAEGRIVY
jgi:Flp pilus assembly protein TadG